MQFKTKRAYHFLINAVAFSLCYQTSNYLAQKKGITNTIAFHFEENIPFLQWMILPYLSSGLLISLGFLWIKTEKNLIQFSHRLLLATVTACFIFALYPLQFSFSKPSITSVTCQYLFDFLSSIDRPYNQFPSLHIAFCFIVWESTKDIFTRSTARLGWAVWIFFVGISTIFTFQHHILDLLGGVVLGAAVIKIIPKNKNEPSVAFYYLMTSGIIGIVGIAGLHRFLAAYLVASLLLVSAAYQLKKNNFLYKKDGRHPWYIRLIYAPYLLGYWLTWLLVQYKEKDRPPFYQYSDRLWVGRRLTKTQANELPNHCVIIDLSIELSETINLNSHRYFHFPLLDLIKPSTTQITEILKTIRSEINSGHHVYIHCAMGYSRCIYIAQKIIEN